MGLLQRSRGLWTSSQAVMIKASFIVRMISVSELNYFVVNSLGIADFTFNFLFIFNHLLISKTPFWIYHASYCFNVMPIVYKKTSSSPTIYIFSISKASSTKHIIFSKSPENSQYLSVTIYHLRITSEYHKIHFSTTSNLLALSAGALAFPSSSNIPNNQTSTSVPEERTLEKRFSTGSIAAFATKKCTDKPIGARPKDEHHTVTSTKMDPKDCIVFCSDQKWNGINWGDDLPNSPAVVIHAFTDTACQTPMGNVSTTGYNNPGNTETNTCVSQSKRGGPWGSVHFEHEYVPYDCTKGNIACWERSGQI